VPQRPSQVPAGQSFAADTRARLEILRKAIEFAADIGLRIIQIMGYDVFYEPSDEQTRANFVESIKWGTRWAGEAG